MENPRGKIFKLVESNIIVSQSIKDWLFEESMDGSGDDADSTGIPDTVLLEATQQYENMGCGSDVDSAGIPDDVLVEATQQYEKMDDDDEVDSTGIPDDVLVQATQQYEEIANEIATEVTNSGKDENESTRFAKAVTNGEIESLRKSGVPAKTRLSTAWSVNVWSEWAKHRNEKVMVGDEKSHGLIDDVSQMSLDDLSFWLPRFVMEVKKEKGDDYPPNSLYSLCCGIQRRLRCDENPVVSDINIFTDSRFKKFTQVLDARMKQLQSTGLFEKKSAEVISEETEDRLWELGVLGDGNPQVLLDTIFYYIGLYFALRGGDEHRRLRYQPCQISLHEPPTGKAYLVYTEDCSKTNQGGLLHRDRIAKKITHYANEACPERCLVRLFKLYMSKCPPDRPLNAFYLKPLKRPKGDIWYQKVPIGHNILAKMVSRMMKDANIPGHYTNHSLRSTATSRLFNAKVDEQLIMARTGHSSTKGVRSYKRANDQLLQDTSDVLNSVKKPKEEGCSSTTLNLSPPKLNMALAHTPQLGSFNITSSS